MNGNVVYGTSMAFRLVYKCNFIKYMGPLRLRTLPMIHSKAINYLLSFEVTQFSVLDISVSVLKFIHFFEPFSYIKILIVALVMVFFVNVV